MSNNILVVLAALLCTVFCAPTKNCPGGAKEGDSLDRGRTWYQCKDGELMEMGCLSEQSKRLNIGETYHNAGYVFECVKDSDRVISRPKACLSEDTKEHMPEDTWQDDNYWYKCTMVSSLPTASIEGCIDGGKRMNVDETIVKGDLVYACKRNGNGNTGFEIYPNPDKAAEFNKADDHIQKIQNVPTFINT